MRKGISSSQAIGTASGVMSVMEGGVPGSPLVKTLHSKAGGASSIPG